MKRAVSNARSTFTPGGSVLRISGSSCLMPATITSGLPAGVGCRPRCTAGTPSICALLSVLAAPSSTVATSLSRTRRAPSLRTTISRKPSTLFRSLSTRTLDTTYCPLTLPGAAW